MGVVRVIQYNYRYGLHLRQYGEFIAGLPGGNAEKKCDYEFSEKFTRMCLAINHCCHVDDAQVSRSSPDLRVCNGGGWALFVRHVLVSRNDFSE